MAYFNNKRTKIRLLCEKAEKEDIERERLAEEGYTNQQIEEYIQNKRLEKFRRPATTHPTDENKHVVNGFAIVSTGLPGTHLAKSETKEMFARAQKRYDKYLLQKNTDKEQANGLKVSLPQIQGGSVQLDRAQTAELERKAKKLKSKQIQREQDHVIKTQNFRDHLKEMSKGMDELNKMPTNSHYAEQFVFDKPMQELCDTQHFDHHLMQNDLKWYNEAYVRYKSTMRK